MTEDYALAEARGQEDRDGVSEVVGGSGFWGLFTALWGLLALFALGPLLADPSWNGARNVGTLTLLAGLHWLLFMVAKKANVDKRGRTDGSAAPTDNRR